MTQFYVSCEDDLMRIFGGDRIKALMDRLGVEEDALLGAVMEARRELPERIRPDSPSD